MTFTARNLALKLLQLTTNILPNDRKDWALGMRAELDHLPDRTALSFACGCLFAAVQLQATSPAFVLSSARWFLATGAAGWSALHFWFANSLTSGGSSSAAILSYTTALLFAFGAFLTARFGLRAAASLAAPLALFLGGAVIWADFSEPATPEVALLKALALEDFMMLTLALLIALGIPKLAAAKAETGK